MGQSVAKIREEAEYADEQKKQQMEERLRILERMVKSHLDTQHKHIIAGERGDQEIYSGTVVEEFKQVNLVMEDKASPELESAVDDFFEGSFLKGFGKLIHVGIKAVLGNASMGEYESSSMLIVWSSNALLRLDTYCYRWNFATKGVIEKTEGAIGILMIQRVIDITKTDPQVLTWAISRQASLLGNASDASTMIDDAMETIKKVTSFQKEVKGITDEEKWRWECTVVEQTDKKSLAVDTT